MMTVLLETKGVKKYYPILGGVFRRQVAEVKACDGIDMAIERGEWFGLVGESGCGKTTLGKTILRLIPSTAGSIFFDVPPHIKEEITSLAPSHSHRLKELLQQYDIVSLRGKKIKQLRRKMQIVYQDPSTSLNPRMTVKDIVGEPLLVHGLARGRKAQDIVAELLLKVGLTEEHLFRYPHEFSGGQRQRIAIARAMATSPEFIVLDEPTSALDVSVQAQILNLLRGLKTDLGLTYLYITHDLSVAQCVCDRIGVMYLGKLVEIAPAATLFLAPKHPYSRALVSSIPLPQPGRKRHRVLLPGEVPSPVSPPPGCRFHPRCSLATEECRTLEPPLESHFSGHHVACWHPLSPQPTDRTGTEAS